MPPLNHDIEVLRHRLPGRVGIALIAALLFCPIGQTKANWLTDVFKGKQGHGHVRAHASLGERIHRRIAASRFRRLKVAALAPVSLTPLKFDPSKCNPATLRLVVDVGHTTEAEGAISARNVPEFDFNLRLARRIVEKLKTEGFAATRLLVTEGRAKASLVKRVATANDWPADLFLSIHHDSVPDKMLEEWEFDGKKSHFSDRFSGYSVFVSHDNPEFDTSFLFAELLAKEMKTRGLKFAEQYALPMMGHDQHELLDKDSGVYRYDELRVLKTTRMPAVLLEAGSIINRDEELQMASPERRDIIASAVTTAVRNFCRPKPLVGAR